MERVNRDHMPASRLVEAATTARRIFSGILAATTPTGETKGSCAHATFLMKMMVEQFTGYECRYRGGDGESDGGYFDDAGGHGHYWLEVETPDGDYVVDITADQFGADPVVVLLAAGSRYVPGDQQLVDYHFKGVAEAIVNSI